MNDKGEAVFEDSPSYSPKTDDLSVLKKRIGEAIEIAIVYNGVNQKDHKAWLIDQMVRILAAEDYEEVIRKAKDGDDGPNTYGWDLGVMDGI